MRFPLFSPKPAPYTVAPGSGKKLTFNASGETSFLNFTAAEIIEILTVMQSATADAVSTEFSREGV